MGWPKGSQIGLTNGLGYWGGPSRALEQTVQLIGTVTYSQSQTTNTKTLRDIGEWKPICPRPTRVLYRKLWIISVRCEMALRRFFGFSDGELMRSDAKPCSRLTRQTAGLFSVGGGLGFWILCRLHYGPRITVPRSLRWAACGAVSVSSGTALLVRLFSPACEPQNIAAYDKNK